MNSEFSWRVLLIALVIFVTAIATLLILVELFTNHGVGQA
jgi:hypothetical protein